MSQMIELEIQLFTDPDTGLALGNGLVYVGVVGTDPTQVINQIALTLRQEDGTEVATAQPVTLGGGGIPVYNGSPAQIMTAASDYSLAVHDKNDAQVYYVGTRLINAAVAESAANAALTAADVVTTNADVVLTNADVVITNADVVSTNADAAQTAADVSTIDAAIDSALDGLNVKKVDIGDWNMDTTTAVTVTHGLDLTKIIGVIDVLIRNDGLTNSKPLMTTNEVGGSSGDSTIPQGGVVNVGATGIILERLTSGIFDDAGNYVTTSFNRGYITFLVTP